MQSLILPRYNKQHKQNQGTLALLVRVVAKINVRIEQNPGYGVLKTIRGAAEGCGSALQVDCLEGFDTPGLHQRKSPKGQ